MLINLCITPERRAKTSMIMKALWNGDRRGTRLVAGAPRQGEPFMVWGQRFLTERIVPAALAGKNLPFWQIDNGFWDPAGGRALGYYRFTFRSPGPASASDRLRNWALTDGRIETVRKRMKPWRTSGRHILIVQPGPYFGQAFGLDMATWARDIEARVRAATDRPIVVRDKTCERPLAADFEDCFAIVTHSSMAGVEAVLEGIPAFVEPTCAAAELGNVLPSTGWRSSPEGDGHLDFETPARPEREPWLAGLACQHFTLPEMADGTAWRYLPAIAELTH